MKGKRIHTYARTGVFRTGAALAALLLGLKGACALGDGALREGLRSLAENEAFVEEAIGLELPQVFRGETESGVEQEGTGTDSGRTAGPAAVLAMRHAFVSDLDGTADDSGGADGAGQTASAAAPGGTGGLIRADSAAGEVTLSGSADAGGINNQTGKTVDVAALLAEQIRFDLDCPGPKVLIYHTHGSEAFTPEGDDVYIPTDVSRTENPDYNMLRVGREVVNLLAEYGIEAIQAETLHDYPSYTGSYARSLETVEDYLAAYPSIQVVLDLHRDALEGDGVVYKTVAETYGTEKTAQMLIIVGTDETGLYHPDWQENLAFGLQLQQKIDGDCPTLARPLSLRGSRFNQQLRPCSLLVEIGSSGNTLQEALRCARLFAGELAEFMLDRGGQG